MTAALFSVPVLLFALGAAWAARWAHRSARARERLGERRSDQAAALRPRTGGLRGTLVGAGLRDARAPLRFGAAAAASALVSGGLALLWMEFDLAAGLAVTAESVPGPAGALLGIVPTAAPVALAIGGAVAPWLWLRGRRRDRRAAIENDLPLTVELIATLSEAGIGFESALGRVLSSQSRVRPLADELAVYQSDVLAGATRVRALARLRERAQVPALDRVVAALVQADQVGSGVSDVLRTQSDDLRQLQRERALASAERLEVKLVFPLVTCFLPGLFLAVIGPAIYQFVQLIDRIVRQGALP